MAHHSQTDTCGKRTADYGSRPSKVWQCDDDITRLQIAVCHIYIPDGRLNQVRGTKCSVFKRNGNDSSFIPYFPCSLHCIASFLSISSG
jgi:hypothetical protein